MTLFVHPWCIICILKSIKVIRTKPLKPKQSILNPKWNFIYHERHDEINARFDRVDARIENWRPHGKRIFQS